ncbi:MAG: aldo/keto reductase [Clostridiaceae bacterium]|nr:aldo/keto reductase [Clostridiaceae bacterium]
MKLCLGTVQQGMEYGINNQYGKPSTEDSMAIFHEAVMKGIAVFDTARAYGNAELLLGEYFKNYGNREKVRVISKLRPNILQAGEAVYDTMHRECECSLKRIGIEKLDGYLLHTPEYIRDTEAVNALVSLREEGMVKNIGVSIYNMADGDIAVNTGVVDYIQLPFSIFDQRGITSGLIHRAKAAGITLFARSAFLQGLYFMNADSLPDKVKQAGPMLKRWNSIRDEYGFTPEEILIEFVKLFDEIDYLVFGVDTLQQLKRDIAVFHSPTSVDERIWKMIRTEFVQVSRSIIIPSLWSDGRRTE